MMTEQDLRIKIEKEQAVLETYDKCIDVMEAWEQSIQIDYQEHYHNSIVRIRSVRNQYAASIDSLTSVLEGSK